MKKQIVLATIATLATTSAYATKARMNALGQAQDRGSFYINDTRNVFRNAARINQTNNYAITEWGTATNGAAGGGTENAPNAEGGFFKNAGSFNYGVYLGNKSQDKNYNAANAGYADGIVTAAGGTAGGNTYGLAGFLDRSNDLDLFFGGDMGVEWGVNLHYANSKAESGTAGAREQKYSNLGLGLGMVMGDLNAYINYTLSDEAEEDGTTAGSKIEDDGSMNIGVGYNMMDFTFFVDYNKNAVEFTAGTGVAATTTESTVITAGAGYTKEVSSTSRMFTDLSLVLTSAEDSSATTNANVEADTTTLPLTVGFETDATSWLTVRGSITQNIFINSYEYKAAGVTTKAKGTNANTTNVQAGATLNFGKLMVDGMIGTQAGSRAGAPGTDAGVLATDNLMTQVAVHYWF